MPLGKKSTQNLILPGSKNLLLDNIRLLTCPILFFYYLCFNASKMLVGLFNPIWNIFQSERLI